MGAQNSDAAKGEAWSKARRQHGVLTHGDLIALGFTPRAIKHRVATGRLFPVFRGVYAVGRSELTRKGRWMAAVLACGEDAVLSHRSAAALWGIGSELEGRIDISVRGGENRRPGIRARTRPHLPAKDVTRRDGIPVTGIARTILDIAAELGDRWLERAINEADKLDLIDPETLRVEAESFEGQPGIRRLRRILDRDTFRLSDSDLEILFRPIARDAGLPPPLTKQRVNGFEVDFYWPELGLIVETDGLRYHRTASAQSRDALRGQTHTAAGLTPLRFSHHQVKYEPAHVRRTLVKTARNLKPACPAPLPAGAGRAGGLPL
jgi:very-short-patch-repair endonuclease/predicted transcriptional regulator of viral defense system